MKHHAEKLHDYHVWANTKIFAHLKTLPEEVYTQELQSVFPSIAETLRHIYLTDIAWLTGLTGQPFEQAMAEVKRAQEESSGRSLAEMERLFAEIAERYRALFRQQNLDEIAVMPHPVYGELRASYTDVLQHVVNHGTYHRGNITAMLRQQNHPGVSQDYVFFLYEHQNT